MQHGFGGNFGQPPLQPPAPGFGGFSGQPNSETVGPNHPTFHHGGTDPSKPNDPTTRLPPGSVPPGASYDPIGPPVSGLNRFVGPNNDELPPPQ